MNRKILFRGKRVDNGEWVIGGLIDAKGKAYIIVSVETECLDGENTDLYATEWYEVLPDTICQYTGLTDKNGKKIWENDIFKCYLLNKYASIKYGTYQIGFDSRLIINVGFYADWSEDSSLKLRKDLGYWVNVEEIEIIGNIFDSFELLDEKREWNRLS